ncbi:MAG: sarcosine oxidase subunit gamma [Paracoccaceae bacterium]|nr:sarcosine oxidase subunit gamma [Paracoccaceae bacterium]
MASLITTSAFDASLPVAHGALTLAAAHVARITSVAPFNGKEKSVSAALKSAHGLAFPAPNRVLEKGAARIAFAGRGTAFLIDADPAALDGLAALTDQSDGWATLRLTGAGAEDALARLVPIDLRSVAFPAGSAARTSLGHMMTLILSVESGFDILVMRSMAHTATHEITTAMAALSARTAHV